MAKITELPPQTAPELNPDTPDTPDTADSGQIEALEPAETFLGRPRADGAPPGSLKGVTVGAPDPDLIIPSPRFNKYASDHINAPQRTTKLWAWCSQLKKGNPRLVQQLVGYVYRDFPPLLNSDKKVNEYEYDYIDVVAGSEMFESDGAFNDRYGAGDYHMFLNVGTGKPPYKRTLATAFIKGSRDFRSMPPSDKRITEMGADGFPRWIDPNDPQSKTYIEYLRGRGVIPEPKHIQEERKVAEAQAAQAKDTLVERLVDKIVADKESSAPKQTALESDTIKNVIEASLTGARASTEMLKDTIKTLQEQFKAAHGGSGDASAMLGLALEIADKISKANNPEPYLALINKLNDTVMSLKMEALDHKIEQLKAQAPVATTNPVQSGVSSLKSTIEDFKAIKELFGDLGGEAAEDAITAKMPWWAQALTSALPVVEKVGMGLLQAYMMSQAAQARGAEGQPNASPQPNFNPMPIGAPSPTPAPAPMPGNVLPMVPSAIDPAVKQQAFTNLVMSVAVPLTNCILGGESGEDFANWFIGGYGEQIYNEVLEYGEPMMVMAMTTFPPVAQRLTGIPVPQIEKFVHEFAMFDEEEYDKKKAAEDEKDDEPTPIKPAS